MIRRVCGFVLGMGALLVTHVCGAQTTEYPQWRWNSSSAWEYSIAASCAAHVADQQSRYNWITVTDGGTIAGTDSHAGHAVGCIAVLTETSNGVSWGNAHGYPQHRHVTDPPPAPSCENNPALGVGETFTTSIMPSGTGGTYCNAVSNCKMEVSSSVSVGGSTVYKVTHTSEACATGAEPAPGEDLKDGETCVGTDPEFCMANSGNNCGYVNGALVCFPKVANDECSVASDGSRVCGTDAPTPPVPDNGTEGTAAEPDSQLSSTVDDVTTTYDYYNSTTVSNSSRDPGTSGDNPYEDDDEGDGEDEEEGEGSASGGEGCDAEPECSGDTIMCAVLQQQWFARCPVEVTQDDVDEQLGDNESVSSSETDMSDALDENLIVGSTGVCPAPPVISLPFGGSVEITVITWFCALAEKIAPLIMIAAYMAALMIVARGTEG